MNVYPPPDYSQYPSNQYPPVQPVWDPVTNTYIYPQGYTYPPNQYPVNQYPPTYTVPQYPPTY